MTIDIVRMRVLVRRPTGVTLDDSDWQDSDIDEKLNFSFWEIQDKFPFREKERTGTFQTVIGTRDYQMPSPFECLTGLSIVDLTSFQHTPIDKWEQDTYEQNYVEGTQNYGKPTRYVREQCFARLWPTPDQVYTINIRRNIILTDLSGSNPTLSIPQVWTEIIIQGAIWRVFFDLGDFARANAVKQNQVTLINTITPTEQKELKDTRRAGLEVLGRDFDMRDEPEQIWPRRWDAR